MARPPVGYLPFDNIPPPRPKGRRRRAPDPPPPPRPPKDRPIDRAREAGHKAAHEAAAHADAVADDHGWQAAAIAAVVKFAYQRTSPWLLEDARKAAEDDGLEIPPDRRAWGAIVLIMKRDGQIEPAGFQPAVSSRGGAKTLWRWIWHDSRATV
jgi:hypothetical protein